MITDLPDDCKIMTQEPFGPLAPIVPFKTFDEVVERANSLPYGLAAYAFTGSAQTANMIGDALQSGMVGVNSHRDLDAGDAVRRHQGIRLRQRRRHRGLAGLSEHEVHLAGSDRGRHAVRTSCNRRVRPAPPAGDGDATLL